MSGFAIWYLIKENHPLHKEIEQINAVLGTTPMPAHIPIISNLQLLSTAVTLLQAYDRKRLPTFRLSSRPTVASTPRYKTLNITLRSNKFDRLWNLPLAERQQMFYNDELCRIPQITQREITPNEYDLVIMDCRYLDKRLWKRTDGWL